MSDTTLPKVHIDPEDFLYVENREDIELPDSFLPDRESRALCLYDVAELYEWYTRLTVLPAFSGIRASDFSRRIGARLDDGLGQAGSQVDDTLQCLLEDFSKIFSEASGVPYIGSSDHVFVDPDEALPSDYSYGRCGGSAAACVRSRSVLPQGSGAEWSYSHSGTANGSFSRGTLPRALPFRALAEADMCTELKEVTLSNGVVVKVPEWAVWTDPSEAQTVSHGALGTLWRQRTGPTHGVRYCSPLCTMFPGDVVRTCAEGGGDVYSVPSGVVDLGTGSLPDMPLFPFGSDGYVNYAKQGMEYDPVFPVLYPDYIGSTSYPSTSTLARVVPGPMTGVNYWVSKGLPGSFGTTPDLVDARKVFVPPAPDLIIPYCLNGDGEWEFPPSSGFTEPGPGVDVTGFLSSIIPGYLTRFPLCVPYRQPLDSMQRWKSMLTRTVHQVYRVCARIDETSDETRRTVVVDAVHPQEGSDTTVRATYSRQGRAVFTARGIDIPYGRRIRLEHTPEIYGIGMEGNSLSRESSDAVTDYYHSTITHDGVTTEDVTRISTVTHTHSVSVSRFIPCAPTQSAGGVDLECGAYCSETGERYSETFDDVSWDSMVRLIPDDTRPFVKSAKLFAIVESRSTMEGRGYGKLDDEAWNPSSSSPRDVILEDGHLTYGCAMDCSVVWLGDLDKETGEFSGTYDPYDWTVEPEDAGPAQGQMELPVDAALTRDLSEICGSYSHEVNSTVESRDSSGYDLKAYRLRNGYKSVHAEVECVGLFMIVDWDFSGDSSE